MKAAWYEALGPAREVLIVDDMAMPSVGAGEVLVRVHASGVNPSDVKQRSGWGGLKMRAGRVVPHNDGAGIIEAVGEGVSSKRIGQRVWLYKATFARAMGTAAEYVALPAEQAVELPESVSFATGASLGVPAMTAHHCIFKDGSVKDQTLLVTGGAGAVGRYAIQLAKWGGAQVITTVSTEAKAEMARAAGADHVINYKTESVVEAIRAITQQKAGIDRVVEVDFASDLGINLALLKNGGVIATYASDSDPQPPFPFYALAYKNLTIHMVLVYAMSALAYHSAITDIAICLEAGILQPQIAQHFPLSQIAAAHEMQESGKAVGKIIVDLAR